MNRSWEKDKGAPEAAFSYKITLCIHSKWLVSVSIDTISLNTQEEEQADSCTGDLVARARSRLVHMQNTWVTTPDRD